MSTMKVMPDERRAARERAHRARIAQIESVRVVCGRADRSRYDSEETILERARLLDEELASHAATERGIAALGRLLRRIEEGPAARVAEIRGFVDAVWNHKPLPILALRDPDPEVATEMIEVLDAWRLARCVLVEQVEGGVVRVAKACRG